MRATVRSAATTVVAVVFGALVGAVADYAAFRLGLRYHGIGELTTAIISQWVMDNRRPAPAASGPASGLE